MKILMTIFCLLILSTGTSLAETRYISDVLVVTVRSQPGNGEQVLTTVRTGAPLEVLEDHKDYLLVRTEKGITGYVRKQYVSNEIPKLKQINQLKAQVDKLQQENIALGTKASQAEKTTNSLSTTEKELTRLKTEFAKLKQASANVLQITRERDQLQQENSDLTGRLQQLKDENSLYLRTGVIKWFLAGAGVLFFGWVLGKISRKKKRSYL